MATASVKLAPATSCGPVKLSAQPTKAPSRKALERAGRHVWAHAGVGLCVTLSAGLNAYANAQHATVPLAGAAIGIMIPCLVFILCKVAGMQWKAKSLTLARFTASVGVALLALSVWHCACSLALLTGSHILLALPLAVAIDGGLIACECDVILG